MDFNERVYALCRKIPKGRVTTYKIIGDKLGKGQIYRAVGRALNKNPYSPKVPCHRVISSSGFIGGFASGIKNKIKLLEKEGIEIKNDKIDLKKYLFKIN